ncbi:MAG: GNAT family N-acetyltransferase [Nitrososphaerales archaeon]
MQPEVTSTIARHVADLINSQNKLSTRCTPEEIMRRRENCIVHYDSGGKVVGVVEVKKVQWYQCEIYHLSVSPDAKRKGIGSELVRLAEQKAIELGTLIAQCTIRVDNEPSICLFRDKFGYKSQVTFLNEVTGNEVAVYQKKLVQTRR